ncbi:MAG: esterase, partial [Fusobacterium sp.]|nr:esterase [Fusobacterium sp.]
MSIKFLLLFTLIMGLLFYVITYPYQSKLVRKLKRVKSYEEVTFLKNSDLDYSKITKEDIDREITQEEGYIDSSFVSERMKYVLITPNVDSYDNIPCLFL